MEISKDLIAASAEPLILSILAREDSYGYALLQQIRGLSSGKLNWSDGMLYPVLHRLERQSLIRSYWKASESGRKRKYYRVSKRGKTRLKKRLDQWETVNSLIGEVKASANV